MAAVNNEQIYLSTSKPPFSGNNAKATNTVTSRLGNDMTSELISDVMASSALEYKVGNF